MFSEDLTAFVSTAEFADAVLVDGVVGKGIFDQPDESIFADHAQSTECVMRYIATEFPDLRENSVIDVQTGYAKGIYLARDKPMRVEDGAFKQVLLKRSPL
jgi:hypothetical protein